jgi:hypothetical protein
MKSLTRTQYKLEEARFFLLLLEQNWRHFPHVDYFLSAFVSAARSITWVMRSEYSTKPGWLEWFDAKKPSPKTRDLLKQMNDVRVRATKTVPLKTRTTATVTIRPEQVTPDLLQFLHSDSRGQVRLEPTDPSNTEALLMLGDRVLGKARIDNATHELPEFQGRDVREVGKEYLAELEELCAECRARFGPKNEP